ncbi:hypothetical protein A2U01_0039927, partial [Trifolium medium]|nr:hypothetical protein [Trifolium medium]
VTLIIILFFISNLSPRAMAEENKVIVEQLSTIERLVKLSILFTTVTAFLFSILLIALPPPPTEIATQNGALCYSWQYPLADLLSQCSCTTP